MNISISSTLSVLLRDSVLDELTDGLFFNVFVRFLHEFFHLVEFSGNEASLVVLVVFVLVEHVTESVHFPCIHGI